MCIAQLNVSLGPCRHRWYHLHSPCTPSANLANCSSKLALAGWEIKCDFCPYCDDWEPSPTEFRLVGNDSSPAIGGFARSTIPLATQRREARRESRRGSLSRTDSNTSVSMMAQEKNRAMNARVDAYFRVPQPETSSVPAPLREVDDENNSALASSTSSDTSSEPSEGRESLRQAPTFKASGLFKKMGRKSKRVSMSLFK